MKFGSFDTGPFGSAKENETFTLSPWPTNGYRPTTSLSAAVNVESRLSAICGHCHVAWVHAVHTGTAHSTDSVRLAGITVF